MIGKLSQYLQQPRSSFGALLRRQRARYVSRRVSAILAEAQPPVTTPAEEAYEMLQRTYPARPAYGYDIASLWQRASSRALHILSLNSRAVGMKAALEVGAGDGMLGVALDGLGYDVTLLDQSDWRHELARKLRYCQADCASLPFGDAEFDLICSYNSFEHFPDPGAAFAEMARVLRPGGVMHLEFNPLYASPWGLHAYRVLRMPYPQFLFGDEFRRRRGAAQPVCDLGRTLDSPQPLNQWTAGRFRQLFMSRPWASAAFRTTSDLRYLPIVLEFPSSFRGRGLSFEDITVDGIIATLEKPLSQGASSGLGS